MAEKKRVSPTTLPGTFIPDLSGIFKGIRESLTAGATGRKTQVDQRVQGAGAGNEAKGNLGTPAKEATKAKKGPKTSKQTRRKQPDPNSPAQKAKLKEALKKRDERLKKKGN